MAKKSSYVKRLDTEFSLFIRLRDTMPNGMFNCISCSFTKPFNQADCGHYISRLHMSVRYDEDNCHAECQTCNRFTSSHLKGYRRNLINKIGIERFNQLKSKSREIKQYSIDEIKELAKYYRSKAKELKNIKGL